MNASMGSQWEAKNFAFFGWRKNLYKNGAYGRYKN